MEILSQLGRCILLTAAEEFNAGRLSFPQLTKAIVDRYGFATSPKTFEDWQNQNGAEFLHGRWGQTEIARLIIYGRGLALDTRVSTEESDRIVDEMLAWAGQNLNINYKPRPSHRRIYASEITFASELDLDALHPALKALSAVLEASATEQWKQRFTYHTTGLSLGVDDSNIKFAPLQFRLERKAGTSFADKTYYSVAQLQTEQHKKLLREIESALTQANAGEKAR